MHRILAEKSVNITELRKNPAKYFIDQPVAVLSNNDAGIQNKTYSPATYSRGT